MSSPEDNSSSNFLDYLPLVFQPNFEAVMAIGLRFKVSPPDNEKFPFVLNNYIAKKGLRIAFRIDGKYRDYLFELPVDEHALVDCRNLSN